MTSIFPILVQIFCSSSNLTEISIRFESRVSSFLFLSANVTIFVTSALIHDRHTVHNAAKVFFEVAFEVNLEFSDNVLYFRSLVISVTH